MISPQKASTSAVPNSPRTAIPLNGLFVNGTWRCNCPQRPPAIKFQTKNNGVNHGRWFWTCQQPQQSRCNFFLWANDAEVREKIVVLSHSRSESFNDSGDGNGAKAGTFSVPTTPSKGSRQSFDIDTGNGNGLLTPHTERKIQDFFTPVSSTRGTRMRMMEEDMDPFEEDDKESGVGGRGMMSFQDRLKQVGAGADETPRKAPRTATTTSPGKRKLSDIDIENEDDRRGFQTQRPLFASQSQTQTQSFSPTQALSQSSPSFSFPWRPPPSSAELCQTPTPKKYNSILTASPSSFQQLHQPSDLANQALSLLESQSVVIPRSTQEDLVSLLNKFDLQMKGVERGRDISRAALKRKDEEIMRLNERVKNLERQREMDGADLEGSRER